VRLCWAVPAGFGLVALAGPGLIPDDQVSVIRATGPLLAPPSRSFPFGTDENGLAVLALTVRGARISLFVGVSATLIAITIAVVVGVSAGHFRAWPAAVLSRLIEWFLVLPQLPFATALAAVLRPSATSTTLAIAVTSWAGAARTLQMGVHHFEALPYLDPVRALGGGHWHQLRRQVIPAVAPLIGANALLIGANAILAESAMAFLGLGDPGQLSWGRMLQQAATSGAITAGAWWYLLAPGVAIIVLVVVFAAAGRTLEAGSEKGPRTPSRSVAGQRHWVR